MPFQVSSSLSSCELSFDKTQTVESFPRKYSVSFLERNSISRKSSLLEKKPKKTLQVRISTWGLLCAKGSIWYTSMPRVRRFLVLSLQLTPFREQIIPLISALGFPIYQKREPEVFFSLYLNTSITLSTSFSSLWGKQHSKFFAPLLPSLSTTPHANRFLSCVLAINSTLETS